MGTDELVARLLALRAAGKGRKGKDVAYRDVLHGRYDLGEVQRAAEFYPTSGPDTSLVTDCPNLYLWAPDSNHRTPDDLERMARAVWMKCDQRPLFVVIDYLQRLAASRSGTDDPRLAIRRISAKLRDLSRPEGLGRDWPGAAVLALSSTSRGNYQVFKTVHALESVATSGSVSGKHDAKEYDLVGLGKESGELETDASLVLAMTTDEPDHGAGDAPRNGLVVVAAGRHGGDGMRIKMRFNPACGRFTEDDWPSTATGKPAGDSGAPNPYDVDEI
jgi:replicative DNA helicase